MGKLRLYMNIGMNRTILNSLTKGRGATLKTTKSIYIPSQDVKFDLPLGEKAEVTIGGHYRDIEVEFHFNRDKSRGGSGKRRK